MSNLPRNKRRRSIVTKNTTVIVETCRGKPDRVTLVSAFNSTLDVRCKGGNPSVSPIVKEEMTKAWNDCCTIAEKRLRESGILVNSKGD